MKQLELYPKGRNLFLVTKCWVQRRHRLLSVFGVLIVFFTFVVKDGKRADIKDLMDSIQQAEVFTELKADNQDLRDLLWQEQQSTMRLPSIMRTMSHPPTHAKHRPAQGETIDQIAQGATQQFMEVETYDGHIDDLIRASVDRSRRLVEALPNPEPLVSTADAISADLAKNIDTFKSEETHVMDYYLPEKHDVEAKYLSSASFAQECDDTDIALFEIETRASKLANESISHARQLIERDKRSYEVYSQIGNALFVIGTLLTLSGRIFAVDDLDSVP